MAKQLTLKPEEARARAYADRLILAELSEMQAAVKLSELADRLQPQGIGLATIRSLLASNPDMFAYAERRWVPAARLAAESRPLNEQLRLLVQRFGGPMPIDLVVSELALTRGKEADEAKQLVERLIEGDPSLFLTERQEIALSQWVFAANDERLERALRLHDIDQQDLADAQLKLAKVDWREPEAIEQALKLAAPINLKLLGAVAWTVLNRPEDPRAPLLFDWRAFAAKVLAAPGYIYTSDGVIHPQSAAKAWITSATKIAEKIAPTIDVEDAAPIELKSEDVKRMVAKIQKAPSSVTATQILEEFFEITPSVKTFPDDLQNVMQVLRAEKGVAWVGGDRFRPPGAEPDYAHSVPEPFHFVNTEARDEEGELVDFEVNDEGLSTSLRKLLAHPLATDVLDEEIYPAPKNETEQLRLVLKPIHRELGTFPLCQVPTGWLYTEPELQELLFIDPNGRELQVWTNMQARLMFNLVDWWYEQPVESGAVFSLTKTSKPNVLEFAWLEQTDPVVYISTQRMEELREIASRSEGMSTLDALREVMAHWPKGADFLTILWELNVVRRVRRRLVASLLSSYQCFYQRSGSPVWHYDAKKNDQGVDKSKKKFILKPS